MKKVLVFGGNGLLGSAIVRRLEKDNVDVVAFSSADCNLVNLSNTNEVERVICATMPDTIYHCAGLVGGIGANIERPYEFLMNNTKMAINVIDAAVNCDIENFFYMSSSCAYPATCQQPMKEEYIGSGAVEETNGGYALAKILGMKATKLARKKTGGNYHSYIPCNLYGGNDDFSERGHVISSIIHKIKEAKAKKENFLTLWGDGSPRREFLHVDDAADAIVYASGKIINSDYINIGSGEDISILELAKKILRLKNAENLSIKFDLSKPNGMMQKLLDVSQITEIGWKPKISLDDGISRI